MDGDGQEEYKAPPLRQQIDTTDQPEGLFDSLETKGIPLVDHDSELELLAPSLFREHQK